MEYFVGIDIGTQGARAVLLSENGGVIAQREQDFVLSENSREEQSPQQWWDTCLRILGCLKKDIKNDVNADDIKSIAVTSTSGTVIPLDQKNQPLHNALMYSDKRASEVAPFCEYAAENYFKDKKAYTGFNASSGLCKIVWYIKHFPDKLDKLQHWVHAADFVTGRLSGCFDISDETNALKSGYDIFSKTWPDYLFDDLPLKRKWMPKVVPAGTPIGNLNPSLANTLGLSSKTQIVAGMTDGCASQIASGAVGIGDWNTTIGTTMVIKGVTKRPIFDPKGRLYNHHHPEGYFMPGGAGNTGADWVSLEFKNDVKKLTENAKQTIPSGHISWPLRTSGERFPLKVPQAQGFEPEGLSRQEKFNANMEGVAYLEKYAYQMIEELSGERVNAVYAAGGGSENDVWLTIRSTVLNLPIYKMKFVSGAVGAAILAASKTSFSSLMEAAKHLTMPEKVVYPKEKITEEYERYYKEFLSVLNKKGYI